MPSTKKNKKPKPKPANKPTAVQKLKLSAFTPPNQLEALGGDVDLSGFMMEMRNKAGVDIISAITDANIERTIEGASTLTVTIDDAYKQVMRSGRLGRKVDVNVNGLFFTLVSVKKSQRTLTLTFEEREVNVLRYYDTFLMASRDTMTRAQFVLKMIKEVKEFELDFCIPELNVVPPVSDVEGPNQVEVDSKGSPVGVTAGGEDSSAARLNRSGGIYTGVKGLTVKGAAATNEQIGNANLIIAQGISMHANRKVLQSAIMTAIVESRIENLDYGDRDSVGVFQQRPSMGWPASRDVPTDAKAYYDQAIPLEKKSPGISLNDICQGVQRSGTPYEYGKREVEAGKILDAYGVAGAAPTAAVGTQPGQTSNNQKQTSASTADAATAAQGNFFTRGTLSQKTAQSTQIVLTKENSWDCMQRLANEVNWVCFVVSGVLYYVSEKWLFKSKPFMSISEDTDGVDWIDYDYDEGKKSATVTVQCHLSRWSAPPGSIVAIHDEGIINGRWIVNDVSRSLFDTTGTVTLKKPRPILPEPTSLTDLPSGFEGKDAASITGATSSTEGVLGVTAPMNDVQKQIVSYCVSQLGVPYQWGAESPGVAFDCSGLTQAAYGSAGIEIPRTTYTQWSLGPLRMGDLQPADLLHFGDNPPNGLHHVAIYVGNGKMIEAPHTGANVRVADNFRSRDYFGATCPWEKASKSDAQTRRDDARHGGNRG